MLKIDQTVLHLKKKSTKIFIYIQQKKLEILYFIFYLLKKYNQSYKIFHLKELLCLSLIEQNHQSMTKNVKRVIGVNRAYQRSPHTL